jgi:hypothetical protein
MAPIRQGQRLMLRRALNVVLSRELPRSPTEQTDDLPRKHDSRQDRTFTLGHVVVAGLDPA